MLGHVLARQSLCAGWMSLSLPPGFPCPMPSLLPVLTALLP